MTVNTLTTFQESFPKGEKYSRTNTQKIVVSLASFTNPFSVSFCYLLSPPLHAELLPIRQGPGLLPLSPSGLLRPCPLRQNEWLPSPAPENQH